MLSRSCSEDVILAKAMNLSANDHRLGCLGAMNAMNTLKDHCNTICVHESTPLLVTFKVAFFLKASARTGMLPHVQSLCSTFPY
jgi:hypothetical protein